MHEKTFAARKESAAKLLNAKLLKKTLTTISSSETVKLKGKALRKLGDKEIY